MPRPARIAALVALVLGLLLPAAPASATFPGENGKLAVRQGPANFRIATVNPDGSGLTQITSGSDSFPAWSPDGKWLAFFRFDAGASLWVTRADGSEPRNLAPNLGTHVSSAPAWSPDGAHIAVARGGNALRIFDLNGGFTDLSVPPGGPDLVSEPDWSPDGTKIAIDGHFVEIVCDPFDPGECTSEVTGADIYTLNVAGGGISRLTFDGSNNGNHNSGASWSPDGAEIAFRRNEGIAAMDAAGTGIRQVVNFGWDPAWSPDGTKIAFNTNDFFDVLVVNADGTGLTTILDGAAPPNPFFMDPSWQPITNQPPDCSVVTAAPNTLWPPNKRLRTVELTGATDPDGDAVTVSITGVTQDERVRGARDAYPAAGENAVRLRADRDPRGDGRVYRIAFEATDARGGSCTGTETVSVPRKHKQPAVDSAPPSYDSFGH